MLVEKTVLAPDRRSYGRIALFSFVTMLPFVGLFVLPTWLRHGFDAPLINNWLWILSISYGLGWGVAMAIYHKFKPKFLD